MMLRTFCAFPWRQVLLGEEFGWEVHWVNEHGAWMEHMRGRFDPAEKL